MCKHPTLSSFIEYNLCSLQISTHQGNKVIKIRFYWPSRIHFFFQKLEVFTWIIISWRFYVHILYKNSFCTISSKWISFLEDKLDLPLHQDILDECICPTVLKGTVTVLFIFTYKIFCFLACNCHAWNVTTNSKTCNTALCAFRSMFLCLWKDNLHYRYFTLQKNSDHYQEQAMNKHWNLLDQYRFAVCLSVYTKVWGHLVVHNYLIRLHL